jgi:outer membrane protein OmpA-like peptidoglycan-associated protein
LSLTEKRAVAIKEELSSLGVKPSLLSVIGRGDSKPLVSNDTEKERRTNTRVEISKL